MEPLNIYFKELENRNSTKEESTELIIKARNGDSIAKDTLITNYLLFVVKIARTFINKGVPLEELIAEGNVGLLKAVEKYDPERGPFSTCASFWIKASIIRNCMHNNRLVRLPENVSELMRTDRWTGNGHKEMSLDIPNEDGNSLYDKIPDVDNKNAFSNEDEMLLNIKIHKILSLLKTRDAEIVKTCYGIGKEDALDINEAAKLFNLSPTRINQILRTSLHTLKVLHNSLPSVTVKKVEILKATYGYLDMVIDVTDKVSLMYSKNENIKSSNKLGGDPCHGSKKQLTIQYIYEDVVMTKNFSEGSIVKF